MGDYITLQQQFEAFLKAQGSRLKAYQEDQVTTEQQQQALTVQLEELSRNLSHMKVELSNNGGENSNTRESFQQRTHEPGRGDPFIGPTLCQAGFPKI